MTATAKTKKRRATLSAQDAIRLAAASGVDLKTVRRWAAGEPVRSTTAGHIQRGVDELGMQVSP
jgi:hypothetical protein